jgi:hypothetical protein
LRNDVGLLSEEYDPHNKRLIGNFPQAFSHIALINAAHSLSAPDKAAAQRSAGPSRWRLQGIGAARAKGRQRRDLRDAALFWSHPFHEFIVQIATAARSCHNGRRRLIVHGDGPPILRRRVGVVGLRRSSTGPSKGPRDRHGESQLAAREIGGWLVGAGIVGGLW